MSNVQELVSLSVLYADMFIDEYLNFGGRALRIVDVRIDDNGVIAFHAEGWQYNATMTIISADMAMPYILKLPEILARYTRDMMSGGRPVREHRG